MAVEWTATRVKVFHIPEDQIPDDIVADSPRPENWDTFLVTHLPFKGKCSNLGRQEFILNIQLCGDWAGGTWLRSGCGRRTGYNPQSQGSRWCRSGLSTERDCCTQYVTSED